MSGEVILERRGAVAVVTVSDPERRNALTLDLSQALADTVAACEADAEVGALVLTGAPPAFCAGADLTQLGESREEGLRRIYRGFLSVANCSLPTVAAVNGAAVGAGLNLALACDVRVAGPKARFDARFLNLGIHPGGGMTWMLQRLAGPQTAKAMVLFGEILDAESAVRHGLAWSHAEDAVDTAVALAERAASAPRELAVATKSSMRVTASLGVHADAVETELVPQIASMDSPAFAERLAALKGRISRS
ncbi:enoyl-CoA hydratase [Allokutzneria sp. A3M-2-11 16]|uniref:enoyl-CoA hydratase n=1 Tax=Allokutzneria sp. A3M-2-11 16 TaxID=2962043 RepID=UPI0020B7E55E|nr:enoyl-CoA hydratase [Allokutzneria sp. A3M-2-11 16]MCP3798943.1 enoyl-CoA hydratase [Allokutzneria sp. A3M-2-11 16]